MDASPVVDVAPIAQYLRGEIDTRNAAQLRLDVAELQARTDGDVVLDCSHLEFIDSTGLGALMDAARNLERAQRALVLTRPSDHLGQLLQLTCLAEIFHVETDRTRALEDVG